MPIEHMFKGTRGRGVLFVLEGTKGAQALSLVTDWVLILHEERDILEFG